MDNCNSRVKGMKKKEALSSLLATETPALSSLPRSLAAQF